MGPNGHQSMVPRLWGVRHGGAPGPKWRHWAPLGRSIVAESKSTGAQWAPKCGTEAVGGGLPGHHWRPKGEHQAPTGGHKGPLGGSIVAQGKPTGAQWMPTCGTEAVGARS